MSHFDADAKAGYVTLESKAGEPSSTDYQFCFKPIDRENWERVLELKVFPNQREFVPSPAEALASAYIKPWDEALDPFAIYLNDAIIGMFYVSYTPDSEDNYWFGGFLIDSLYQGKGFGKKAMEMVFEFIPKIYPKCKILKLTVEKDNILAQNLYKSMGFSDTSQTNKLGEIIYTIDLSLM